MPLSSKQMEYLALAWQCFESEPKIDYETFRTVAGLKSAASARELMRVTKNKLKEEYGALQSGMQAANADGTPTKKSATNGIGTSGSKKRGRGGKKAAAEMEDEDDAEETPVKKKRGSPIKKEIVEDGVAEESSEGELI